MLLAFAIVGFAAVVVGVALLNPAVGFIVFGVGLIVGAYLLAEETNP